MSAPRVQAPPHVEFAERLKTACDDSRVPPPNHGRLRWVRENLETRFDIRVSSETVRRWLAGASLPRDRKLKSLASLLNVDAGWLYSGSVSGVREEGRAFNPADPPTASGDRGEDILERIRRRLGGTVTIMPGVDLTEPTGEVWDAERD